MNALPPHGPRAGVHSGGHRPAGVRLPLLLALLLSWAPALPSPARGQDGGNGGGKADDKKQDDKKHDDTKDDDRKDDDRKQDGKKQDDKKDDGKKDDGRKADAPKKKTEEEKLLETLGAAWKAGDSKALAARFPQKRKVSLRLPGAEGGDYRAEQAKSMLEEYFSGRTFSKVELKSVKEMTGTFQVEYVRTADRRRVAAQVLLVLGTEEKERVLVSARESP
jgi:hypothetical protein